MIGSVPTLRILSTSGFRKYLSEAGARASHYYERG